MSKLYTSLARLGLGLAHQTGGGVRDVLRRVDDRDALATISMPLAMQAAEQHA